MKSDYVIGILGGMGTYATYHLFKQYAELFPAEKEWERPRIIIDNRCTMPSRVRAFMYNENVDQLVEEITDSLQMLSNAGCKRIILDCNTSHLFLPRVYEKAPKLKQKVIHLVHICAERVSSDSVKSVFVLGTEGTIESCIYHDALKALGINCLAPSNEEYHKLRECIESVKQNKYSQETKRLFLELVNRYDHCILGCTELPILYEKYKNEVTSIIYDPVFLALRLLHEEYKSFVERNLRT